MARGIDIDEITMVVNYDVPHEAEDYVHRVGRTARANSEGKAVTFISEREQSKFGYIERFLGYEVRKEPMPSQLGEAPEYHPEKKKGGVRKGKPGNKGKSRSGHSRDRKPRQPQNNRPTENNHPKSDSQPQNPVKPAATDKPAEAAATQPKPKKRRYYHRRRGPKNPE